LALIQSGVQFLLFSLSKQISNRLKHCFKLGGSILLMGFLFFALSAQGANLISEKSYWDDSAQQATLDDAQKAQFTSFRGLMFRGYTTHATWVKIHLGSDVPQNTSGSVVIRVRPVYLDQIELYDPQVGNTVPQVTGDRYRFNANSLGTLSHSFLVPQTPFPRDLYLRLITTSTSLMVVDAFSMPDFYKQESWQNDIYSVNLIIQVLLYLWVLVSWMEGRESLSARFLIKQAILIVHTFCFFGYHRMLLSEYLDPIYFDRIFSGLNLCLVPVALWFESSLLNEYSKPKVFNVIFRLIFILSLLNALSLAIDISLLEVLKRNNLLGILTAVSFSLAASFIKVTPTVESSSRFVLKKSWVIAYFYMLMLVTGFGSLGAAGYINMQEITLHSSVVYSLMSGFAMSFLLQYRNLQTRRLHIQTASQLELVSKQATLERERKDEQKHFLGMLMHELKNPLSVIDMSMSIQRVKGQVNGVDASVSRAISDIKSIIDRCIEFDQLDENLSVARKENVNVSKMVLDLIAQDDNRELTWVESIEPDLWVMCDAHYLSVVLNNLIDNARKYRAPASPIQITLAFITSQASSQCKGVCFSIANQVGRSGFPDSSRIFEKYYRSPGAMKSSGTGLGLFLVSNLSQKMGLQCRYVPTHELVRFELWFPS